MGDIVLRERYARVLDRIDAACAVAGRPRESVRLIAVSKLHPAASGRWISVRMRLQMLARRHARCGARRFRSAARMPGRACWNRE